MYKDLPIDTPSATRFNQAWLAILASVGLHALVGLSWPFLAALSKPPESNKERNVELIQLTPEEQKRLPLLSQPKLVLPQLQGQLPYASLPPLPPLGSSVEQPSSVPSVSDTTSSNTSNNYPTLPPLPPLPDVSTLTQFPSVTSAPSPSEKSNSQNNNSQPRQEMTFSPFTATDSLLPYLEGASSPLQTTAPLESSQLPPPPSPLAAGEVPSFIPNWEQNQFPPTVFTPPLPPPPANNMAPQTTLPDEGTSGGLWKLDTPEQPIDRPGELAMTPQLPTMPTPGSAQELLPQGNSTQTQEGNQNNQNNQQVAANTLEVPSGTGTNTQGNTNSQILLAGANPPNAEFTNKVLSALSSWGESLEPKYPDLKNFKPYQKIEAVYPPAAGEKEQFGSALVGVVVNPKGEITDVQLLLGTGNEVLNQEAEKVVRNYPFPTGEKHEAYPVIVTFKPESELKPQSSPPAKQQNQQASPPPASASEAQKLTAPSGQASPPPASASEAQKLTAPSGQASPPPASASEAQKLTAPSGQASPPPVSASEAQKKLIVPPAKKVFPASEVLKPVNEQESSEQQQQQPQKQEEIMIQEESPALKLKEVVTPNEQEKFAPQSIQEEIAPRQDLPSQLSPQQEEANEQSSSAANEESAPLPPQSDKPALQSPLPSL